jgi:hypothetical protein
MIYGADFDDNDFSVLLKLVSFSNKGHAMPCLPLYLLAD